MSDTFEDGYST